MDRGGFDEVKEGIDILLALGAWGLWIGLWRCCIALRQLG